MQCIYYGDLLYGQISRLKLTIDKILNETVGTIYVMKLIIVMKKMNK